MCSVQPWSAFHPIYNFIWGIKFTMAKIFKPFNQRMALNSSSFYASFNDENQKCYSDFTWTNAGKWNTIYASEKFEYDVFIMETRVIWQKKDILRDCRKRRIIWYVKYSSKRKYKFHSQNDLTDVAVIF